MSISSAVSLTPRPFFCSATQSPAISLTAIATPQSQTFTPTFANGILTNAGLTQVSVAQWNALSLGNFTIKGVSDLTGAVVYELGVYTPVAPVLGVVQPSVLTYYATSVSSLALTPVVLISFNV